MRPVLHASLSPIVSPLNTGWGRPFRYNLPSLLAVFIAVFVVSTAYGQQIADRIVGAVDTTQTQPLPNHFPQWANSANDLGAVAPETEIDRFTIVLARSPQQEAAFNQLLADQQNPASPSYHHWLTPAEVGERFGLSENDIAAVTGWLQSQGLHVTFVSPSRIFIGFGGKAGDVGRAFQSELHNYKVNGDQLISVSSEPTVPQALSPVIKAVRGLFTIQDKPLYHANAVEHASPSLTAQAGSTYFVAPADFATIYDLPATETGAGQTIGIVGESRTDFADFTAFRALTGSTFPNPNEIIPTLYGGVDPGPAVTTQETNPPGAQGEATLDVLRAGSVAPGANIDLVVASSASGGIDPAAQYLVNTSPPPAQIMSVSWGGCELGAGASGVDYWDTLFKSAAAEGISVFVASGDSGASGCDPYNATPPASPQANSPNAICSSSYDTCVGGTEFNDASSYSTYWSANNSSTLGSALSYIPEGAWNEPGNTTNGFVASATGGGVSTIIPTPSWQTGTGVPSARTGRYTPDISFSASGHDGYFGCYAAGGGSCVSTNGQYYFEIFSGTSAAAPDMAGIAALLDQKLGAAQGSLNQNIYNFAATTPSDFHDVTVASSGVSGCVVTTPSMCNNSVPSPTSLTGGQSGFLVNAGYDEVTGWGSLDVTNFIDSFSSGITGPQAPTATTGSASAIASTAATVGGTVNPNGAATNVWFLYSTSSTLATPTQTATQAIGSGTTATPVTANLNGLTASTTYYFQVVAQNANGTTSGAIVSFTTSAINSAPTTTTNSASAITATGATLNASVNANGQATNAWFLYGTSSTLATSTQTPAGAIGSATTTSAVDFILTGLSPSTTYYFQAVAQNASGTTSGSIASFTTPALPVFSVTGTVVSVAPGATTGNTSTITVTPQAGFTSTVALTCTFTSNASNDPATCSISPASLTNFTGTTPQTSTLTIGTTAGTSALNQTRKLFWPAGGATLALLMLFGIPARRRSWRAMLGMVALLFILAGGMVACGGSSGGGGGGGGNSGTTAGFYTITVTGTSGSITESSTVSLTVQ